MHAFVLIDLQDLFYMADIEEGAGRNISRRCDRGKPLGGANDRQAIQRCEGVVCLQLARRTRLPRNTRCPRLTSIRFQRGRQ